MTARGIKASGLKNILRDTVIKQYVAELIERIDQEILSANSAGWSRAVVELPTSFSITGVEKKDAQLLVYCDLIEIYEKAEHEGGKGFIVEFLAKAGAPSLILHWNNGMSEDERERRKEILKAHIIVQPAPPVNNYGRTERANGGGSGNGGRNASANPNTNTNPNANANATNSMRRSEPLSPPAPSIPRHSMNDDFADADEQLNRIG